MDAYFSDDDIDEAIDGAFQRWHDCLTKAGVIKPSKTIAACPVVAGTLMARCGSYPATIRTRSGVCR